MACLLLLRLILMVVPPAPWNNESAASTLRNAGVLVPSPVHAFLAPYVPRLVSETTPSSFAPLSSRSETSSS